MEQSELLAYLRSLRVGVLGTLSPSLEPQGALVGYAVTPALEILFDTLRTTRKYRNMMANPHVSFTVGGTRGTIGSASGKDNDSTGLDNHSGLSDDGSGVSNHDSGLKSANSGLSHIDERTVQYEGIAKELAGEQLEQLQPIYFATWPDGVERKQWPGITWFVIRPRWIRFSDFNIPTTQEWTF